MDKAMMGFWLIHNGLIAMRIISVHLIMRHDLWAKVAVGLVILARQFLVDSK
jgi:hypothetical protein